MIGRVRSRGVQKDLKTMSPIIWNKSLVKAKFIQCGEFMGPIHIDTHNFRRKSEQ